MGFFRPRDDDVVLITAAQRSREEELRARVRRYAVTMGVRTVAFLVAVLLPLPGPVKLVAVLLAVCLPWLAVTAANAGPVRQKGRPRGYVAPVAADRPPAALGGHRVIEADETDASA